VELQGGNEGVSRESSLSRFTQAENQSAGGRGGGGDFGFWTNRRRVGGVHWGEKILVRRVFMVEGGVGRKGKPVEKTGEGGGEELKWGNLSQ